MINSFMFLKQRGIPTPDWCVLCGEQVETTGHIFFNYRFSREVLIDISKACDNVLWRKAELPPPTIDGRDIRLRDSMEASRSLRRFLSAEGSFGLYLEVSREQKMEKK